MITRLTDFFRNMSAKRRTSLFFAMLMIISFAYTYTHRWTGWNGKQWKHTIRADGKGYYEYLRAAFIYQDFSYDYIFKQDNVLQEKIADNFLIPHEENGKKHYINQYYAGTAVLMLPFFLLAHGLSALFGMELNGYSLLYHTGISIATHFYLLVGLYALLLLFRKYRVRDEVSMLVMAVFYLGTNLLFYTAMEPAYSHVYSFATISVAIYLMKELFDAFSPKKLLLLGLVFGIMILIRPTNGIIVFAAPFLAGSWKRFTGFFRELFRHYPHLLLGIVLGFSVLFIQLLTYYLQAGEFFIWAYKGRSFGFDDTSRGFDFTNPHIIPLLFSYRKGLFVYMPVTFLAVLALFNLLKKQRYAFFTLGGFMLLFIYFFSCWAHWWNAAAYGPRALVEFYPFFMLPLGFALNDFWQKSAVKWIAAAGLFLFVSFNLLQMRQYRMFILKWEGMTEQTYWRSFLKTAKKHKGLGYKPYLDEAQINRTREDCNGFELPDEWVPDASRDTAFVHQGKYAAKGSHKHPIAFKTKFSLYDFIEADAVFVRLAGLTMSEHKSWKHRVVLELHNRDSVYFRHVERLQDYTRGTGDWEKLHVEQKLPQLSSPEDSLVVYAKNPARNAYWLDDICIRIIGLQE